MVKPLQVLHFDDDDDDDVDGWRCSLFSSIAKLVEILVAVSIILWSQDLHSLSGTESKIDVNLTCFFSIARIF